jgi:hypothetical protein
MSWISRNSTHWKSSVLLCSLGFEKRALVLNNFEAFLAALPKHSKIMIKLVQQQSRFVFYGKDRVLHLYMHWILDYCHAILIGMKKHL